VLARKSRSIFYFDHECARAHEPEPDRMQRDRADVGNLIDVRRDRQHVQLGLRGAIGHDVCEARVVRRDDVIDEAARGRLPRDLGHADQRRQSRGRLREDSRRTDEDEERDESTHGASMPRTHHGCKRDELRQSPPR